MKAMYPKAIRGFTLIELIVVMAIFGLMAVSALGLIQAGGSFFQYETDKSGMEKAARLVMSSIEGAVRRNDTEGAVSIETVSAASPAVRVRMADGGHYYWYYLDSSDMRMRRRETGGGTFSTGVVETVQLSDESFTAFAPVLSAGMLNLVLSFAYNGDSHVLSADILLRSEAN